MVHIQYISKLLARTLIYSLALVSFFLYLVGRKSGMVHAHHLVVHEQGSLEAYEASAAYTAKSVKHNGIY